MPEQHKQQIRIYLRPSALAKAAERSAITGLNLSEAIEQIINGADNASNPRQSTVTPFGTKPTIRTKRLSQGRSLKVLMRK